MAVKSFEEYEKELKKSYAPQEAADIAANEQKYATEKQLTTDTYNRQINETSKSYEDLYDENAVDRFVNEQKIAENMANLGLTDSGLNRTQQTAVQLSYANRKNKIDVTRQKAIDTLTASLADAITKLDIEQNDNAATIKSNYAALASSGAQDMYNNAVQEETKRQKQYYDFTLKALEQQQKAEKEASYIIKTDGGGLSRNYTGSLKENGVDVFYNDDGTTTYIDNNSGKKTTIASNINPYTGTVNPDTANGVWDNGYQPNNIGGNKLKKVDTTTIRGRTQNVFTLVKGHNTENYVWDGESNKYVRVVLNNEGYWVTV